jgi:hypothetical protein
MSELIRKRGWNISGIHPLLGKHRSEETKEKLRIANLGKKASFETREKMSKSQRQNKKHNISEEGRKKLSERMLNEKNPVWKGNEVNKEDALHDWVRRRKLKPEVCEECKKVPPYDLANISGQYKRDINDFKWLCRKCHLIEDGRLFNNLKQFKMEEQPMVVIT